MNFKEIMSLTDGFFLLFLAVSGNFIAETLGCETQFYFSNNIYFKQFIVFLLIYFTINFTNTELTSPLHTFYKTLMLWVFFILFTKMDIEFTLVALILLIVLFIVEKQKQYQYELQTKATAEEKAKLKKHNTIPINILNYQKSIGELVQIQKVILTILLGVVLVGFFTYYSSKKREYGKSFHLFTFLSGVKSCKSLQMNKIITY